MAFALPSFNAAVASANTSGLPLQRLQSAIDFGDVDSTYATKMLGKASLEKFITEANLAKQALNEYGAGLRNKMTLDYKREVLDAEKEELEERRNSARRAKLFEMLAGGAEGLLNGGQQGQQQYQDPRQGFGLELKFRKALQDYDAYEMGGLHPESGTTAAIKDLLKMRPQMDRSASTTGGQALQMFSIPTQATPKLEKPQVTTYQDVVNTINALGSVGRPQKKK